MNLPRLLATLVLLLSCRWALGEPGVWKEFALPLSVQARSEPVQPPEGWQVAAASPPCELVGVTVFDGLPQEQASLVPDADQAVTGGRGLLKWTLTPVSAAGTWVSLSYSCRSLVLSRPLPASARDFRVIYDQRLRVDGLPTIVRAEVREQARTDRAPSR